MPRKKQPQKKSAGSAGSVGSRLRKVRVAFGDAQQDLADTLNVSRAAVSQWEKSIVKPTSDKLSVLARRYRVPFEWLLFGRGSPPNLPIPGRKRHRPSAEREEAFRIQDQWHIPPQALPCLPKNATVIDLAAKRGEYLIVDKSQREIRYEGQWLVQLTGDRTQSPMLVRSRMGQVAGKPVVEVISSDDVAFALRAVRKVVGRVVARYGWVA